MDSRNDYYDYLLNLSEKDLIKECVKNHDAVINLQSTKTQYEKALQKLNCEIDNIQVKDNIFDNKITYGTVITFPAYSFSYKSEKDYIQNIIKEALVFGNCKEYI